MTVLVIDGKSHDAPQLYPSLFVSQVARRLEFFPSIKLGRSLVPEPARERFSPNLSLALAWFANVGHRRARIPANTNLQGYQKGQQ